MGGHIVVAPGSINIDLILRTDSLKGPKTFMGHYRESQGGKGSNQAVAARLAAGRKRNVYLVGCVGRDAWGEQAVAKLEDRGVNTTHVRTTDQAPTGVVMEYLYGDGEVTIGLGLGANSEVMVADIEGARPEIEAASVLLCQIENPLPTLQRAVEVGQSNGTVICLDPSVVPEPGPGRDLFFSRVLPHVDIVAPNRSEALALTGVEVTGDASALEAARALLQTVPVAIVTRSSDGALIARGDDHYFARGHRVAAIDGGAAGDTFRGAFGAALAEAVERCGQGLMDLPFEALAGALDLANAAAALCVTRAGAYPSIPERADIDAFMTQHPAGDHPTG